MAKVSATAGLSESDRSDLLIIQENNTEQILSAINVALAVSLEEIGLRAERHAKAETPVDTGRLRNSITHAIDMDEKAVYIGTNVEYAPYVELGTYGHQGKRMLTRAASEHKSEYEGVLRKHMQSG